MYAIAVGDRGIYKTWNEIKTKNKFVYKKFGSKEECEVFLSKILTKPKEGSLVVFTDGACINNGHKNSKAAIGIYCPSKDIKKGEVISLKTNNQAELLAAKTAISMFDETITIVTDSAFAIYDLWKTPNVFFVHIRSHTGKQDDLSLGNEMADKLATDAIKKVGGDLEIAGGDYEGVKLKDMDSKYIEYFEYR